MRSNLFVLPLLALAACAASTESPSDAVTGDPAEQNGATVLLDCNVFESGGGPDQQITVKKQKGGSLVLVELTNSGSTVSRALPVEEWNKQDIRLRLDRYDHPSTVNRVYKTGGDWANESIGPGWSTYGYADCWVDKSK